MALIVGILVAGGIGMGIAWGGKCGDGGNGGWLVVWADWWRWNTVEWHCGAIVAVLGGGYGHGGGTVVKWIGGGFGDETPPAPHLLPTSSPPNQPNQPSDFSAQTANSNTI